LRTLIDTNAEIIQYSRNAVASYSETFESKLISYYSEADCYLI